MAQHEKPMPPAMAPPISSRRSCLCVIDAFSFSACLGKRKPAPRQAATKAVTPIRFKIATETSWLESKEAVEALFGVELPRHPPVEKCHHWADKNHRVKDVAAAVKGNHRAGDRDQRCSDQKGRKKH